ncbi:MAG: hypothetical protein GY939_22940 [Actinomycetia bacterium]|nr:hypothetical protein [Actinomycetes bacterium]
MGPEAFLKSACELSYVVARSGVESDPVIDPPQIMRSFLYIGALPERALGVAKEAIEEDPAFRRRVAEQASEDQVGRGGYLWLHRPIGWSAEFEELVADSGLQADADDSRNQSISTLDSTETDDFPANGSVETVPAITEDHHGDDKGGSSNGLSPLPASHDPEGPHANSGFDRGSHSEANAIEDELTSLRGLVDRLASERQAVSSSIERVEDQVESSRQQPSVFDSDVYTLRSELEAARIELDEARRERDTAVQQHSSALTRQLDLEKELDLSRELRAEVERENASSDAGLVDLQEALVRAEGALGPIELERDELTVQVESLSAHNEELMTELARLNQERASTTRTIEGERQSNELAVTALRAEQDQLNVKLGEFENDLLEATSQLGLTSTQASEAKSLVEALTEEKIDLASRLADTEAMLETTRTQLGAVKADAEAIAADLSNIKAHRDGLSGQVDELHGSLTEALDSLARVRETSEADRAALKDVRTERDQLKLRVSGLEQVESGLEAKLANITTERASLSTKADEVKAELAELEQRVGELTGDNEALTAQVSTAQEARSKLSDDHDNLSAELKGVRRYLSDAEQGRDALSQQVGQLTAENSAIQDQLVESDRLRVETSESQGHALSELAHRLSLVEMERAKLEDRFSGSTAELAETKTSLETSSERATKAESDAAKAKADAFEALTAKADAEKAVAQAEKAASKAKEEAAEAKSQLAGAEKVAAEAEKAKVGAEEVAAEAEKARTEAETAKAEAEKVAAEQVLASQSKTSSSTTVSTESSADEADSGDADGSVTAADTQADVATDEPEAAESSQPSDHTSETDVGDAIVFDETGQAAVGTGKSFFGMIATPAVGSDSDDQSVSLAAEDTGHEAERSADDDSLDTALTSGTDVEREAELEETLINGPGGEGAVGTDQPSNGRLDLSQPLEADENGLMPMAFGMEPPPALLDDDEGDDSGRTTKRHSWSLGPLLRGRKGAENGAANPFDEPPPPAPGSQSEPEQGPQDDDFDVIAAAVAQAARGGGVEQNEEAEAEFGVPDPSIADVVGHDTVKGGEDDLSLIGAKLANAMVEAEAEAKPAIEDIADDDLDAISDLISQTVNDFDSKATTKPPIAPDGIDDAADSKHESAQGSDEDETAVHPSGGWGVLTGSVNAPEGRADRTSGRNGGFAPPSIFNDSAADPSFEDDPFGADTLHGVNPDSMPASVGSGEDGGPMNRRQITIPEDLRDDEVELARHVVSSPDVVLLVDGDSVAKMGWPSLPVAQQRDALVSYLADLSASSGAAPDVVFDGRIGEEESLPASRAVRIRLSTPPTEPAAALDELVDAYPEQWPIAVVTDDDVLAASAVERGALALNNGQLLDLFIAQ